MRSYDPVHTTAGQNGVKIGRSATAVAGGDGRKFAIDFVVTAVRQYNKDKNRRESRSSTNPSRQFETFPNNSRQLHDRYGLIRTSVTIYRR